MFQRLQMAQVTRLERPSLENLDFEESSCEKRSFIPGSICSCKDFRSPDNHVLRRQENWAKEMLL